MLLVGVFAYMCITLFGAFFLKSAVGFGFLAVMVRPVPGRHPGAVALRNSGKLVPKEHANEYFGFFDIFGKYAAVMGTFLVSAIAQLTGQSNWGVFSLVVLFIVGFLLLRKGSREGIAAARTVFFSERNRPADGRLTHGLRNGSESYVRRRFRLGMAGEMKATARRKERAPWLKRTRSRHRLPTR